MAKSASVKWHGAKAARKVKSGMKKNLATLAKFLEKQTKKNISINTATAGPSKPRQFPHRASGRLYDEVFTKIEGLNVILGDRAPHALFVEATRPYLRRTLDESKSEIGRIMSRPLRVKI